MTVSWSLRAWPPPADSVTSRFTTSWPNISPRGPEQMAPSTFGKREREQTKRAKAEAKRQRRQRSTDPDTAAQPATDAQPSVAERASTDDVLAMIAEVHERYEAGTLSFEEFETTKADLLARIVVD